ncbi:MFS transporter [Chloroflexi bacterium TSY]|nr:MFS transporter [Chloroflexi bacterium TSY]
MNRSANASATESSKWRPTDYFDLGVIGATHGLSDGFSGLLKLILALIVVDLGLSTFAAGILLSVFSVSTFLFLYPVSLLADDSGYKKQILIIGLALSSIAFFAMQWAPGFLSVAVLAFIAGAGNATFHPCGTALTAERFADRRSIAVSMFSMMGNAGASIMPVVQAFLATAAGWRISIAACVFPAAVLLPLVGIRFQNRAQPSTQFQISLWNRLRSISRLVVQNRSVVLLASIYALSGMGTGVFSGFLALFAEERFGVSIETVGFALALYYLAGVVAKPLMGVLYSRWGASMALRVPLFLSGILIFVIVSMPWKSAFLPVVALIGVTVPISPIILTAAADNSDQDALASSVGLIYTFYGLGFISPLVGGWLAERYSLDVSYLYAGLLLWIAASVTLVLRETSTVPE